MSETPEGEQPDGEVFAAPFRTVVVETEDLTTPDLALVLAAIEHHGRKIVPGAVFVERSEDNKRRRVVMLHVADEEQARFYHSDPVILTGIVWSEANFQARAELAMSAGLPESVVAQRDVFDVLPPETKAYLLFWQGQMNSGRCWHAPGSIGARAARLLEAGFLLHSRRTVCNFYGHEQPTRYNDTQGLPGTDAFVRAMMGQRYLDWLKSNEELTVPVP